ncbi:MAG: DMT family transporter [Rubricoccaceae bacterium]|nr:DMT family transporter [Rubricoccaceae bacterium]
MTSPALLARSARAIPLGLRYMAASALFFSLMSLFVKLAGARIPTMEIVFARSVFMAVATYGLLRREGVSPLGRNRGLLLVRGVVGVTALSLLYFALPRIPLGDATAIFYTTPVWTAVAAVLVLRERTAGLVVAGMGVSLLGVALIAKPSFLPLGGLLGGGPVGALDGLAVAAALAASVLSGFVYAVVRKLRETDAPNVIIFYLSAVGVVGALPFAGGWVWPRGVDWLWLLGAGATTQLAQLALTRGLHLEPAGRAMSVGYLQVVFAFGWGVLVFGTVPGPASLLGAALIVGSVLLVLRRGSRRAA